MSPSDAWLSQFTAVALPIIATFAVATWYQSKRIDEVSKRVDDLRADTNHRLAEINARLDRIENRFDRQDRMLSEIRDLLVNHSERIGRLEERTSVIRHES